MLLSVTLTSVFLFLLQELGGNEVYMEEFLFPIGWFRIEVLVMCHCLAEERDDTVLDDVNKVVVKHLDIGIESIDIVKVFLNSTHLPEITNLVERPVWLVVVAIVLSNCVFNLFPAGTPVLAGFPPFQQ